MQQNQRRAFTFLVLLIFASAAEAGQTSAAQNIAAACVGCHASESSTQPKTPMGRALALPGMNPTLASHPKLAFQRYGFSYAVETKGSQSTYSVSDGKQTVTLPIRWSFGQGAQTWVLEKDGDFYESLVSYYPSVEGLAITSGDEALIPNSLDEAMGRKITEGELRACLGCHSTGAMRDGEPNLQNMENMQAGLTCEHCHVGIDTHLAAASQGRGYDSSPPKLGMLSPMDTSEFCGQCHRTWEMVVQNHSRGKGNVRFQPYRLANSKCFDGADPRISCIACHDPHRDVVTDDASYDIKCLACHKVKNRHPQAAHADAKPCPVETSNCAGCHMPKVGLANGLMTFHDHDIRIVKPGQPYPN